MSREIRFRVWRFDKYDYFTLGNILTYHKQFSKCVVNGLQFEQYTGITDEDGIEIYENDLIQDSCGLYQVVFISNGWFLKDLEYTDKQFISDAVETYPECQERLTGNSGKVIGNIHQNKDLLK